MRECPNCKKANLPTRKFCIRCGASLLKPLKSTTQDVKPRSKPVVSTQETVTPSRAQSTTPESPSPVTEDKWIRPSQVPKDRVRHTQHTSQESEFEKAKRAFAKAEEVGIEEGEEGIVETRMLRASEVKELLEGPGAIDAMQPPGMMEGSEPLPHEAEELIKPPSVEAMEEQILGQWSTIVDKKPSTEIESSSMEAPKRRVKFAPKESTGFSSSRYSESSQEPMGPETTLSWESEDIALTSEATSDRIEIEVPKQTELTADKVITCPQCKSIITMDDYEYPVEIYSAMGEARLKQTKYLIVQGKEHDAIRIMKIARVLFERANDGDGLAQLEQLEATLNKGS